MPLVIWFMSLWPAQVPHAHENRQEYHQRQKANSLTLEAAEP